MISKIAGRSQLNFKNQEIVFQTSESADLNFLIFISKRKCWIYWSQCQMSNSAYAIFNTLFTAKNNFREGWVRGMWIKSKSWLQITAWMHSGGRMLCEVRWSESNVSVFWIGFSSVDSHAWLPNFQSQEKKAIESTT